MTQKLYVRPISLAETNTRNIAQNLYQLTNFVNSNQSFNSVTNFGAVGDGVVDDTQAIQAAINSAAVNGGYIYIPRGIYKITKTIDVNNSDIYIFGNGAQWLNGSEVTTSNFTGTALYWAGANGGTLMTFASLSSGNNPNYGGGIRGISFLSNNNGGTSGNIAGVGLLVNGWRYGQFHQLYFQEFSSAGLQLYKTGLSNLAQHNDINTISGLFENQSGAIILLSGDATANASFNYINNVDGFTKNGNGVVFQSADNNVANHLRIFNNSGSGIGVVFEADNSYAANSNIVTHLSANNVTPVYAQGTEIASIASFANAVYQLDYWNNTTAPQIGTAAQLFWDFTANTPRTWAPTLASSGGSVTYTVSQAAFVKNGRWVSFNALFHLTADNGTGHLKVTLPSTPDSTNGTAIGTAFAADSSNAGTVQISANNDTASVWRYDGAYLTTAGGGADFLSVSGSYCETGKQ